MAEKAPLTQSACGIKMPWTLAGSVPDDLHELFSFMHNSTKPSAHNSCRDAPVTGEAVHFTNGLAKLRDGTACGPRRGRTLHKPSLEPEHRTLLPISRSCATLACWHTALQRAVGVHVTSFDLSEAAKKMRSIGAAKNIIGWSD
jgi:hypothetical protein